MRQGLLWMPQNLVPPSPHPLSSGQRVSISILQGRLHYLSVNFLSCSPVHRATLLLAKALRVCAGSALPCTPRVVCCNRLNWLLVYGDENPWLIHPNFSPVWHCSRFLAHALSVYPVSFQVLPLLPRACFLPTTSSLVESGFPWAQVLINTHQLAELQGLGDVHRTVQRTKALKHPLCYPHFLY